MGACPIHSRAETDATTTAEGTFEGGQALRRSVVGRAKTARAGKVQERVDIRRDVETRRRESLGEKGDKGAGETAEARPRR